MFFAFFFLLDQICPPGTYHRLKLSLLLSLVSTAHSTHCLQQEDMSDLPRGVKGCLNRHGLHLLSVGQDMLLLDRLMLYACQFSSSTLRNSASSELFGSVKRDLSSGECFVSGTVQQRRQQQQSFVLFGVVFWLIPEFRFESSAHHNDGQFAHLVHFPFVVL